MVDNAVRLKGYMHPDTFRYLKSQALDHLDHDGKISFENIMMLLKLAFCLGYNHGYLAVDEKMIPTEFLKEFMQKGFESDMIISLDNDGEI